MEEIGALYMDQMATIVLIFLLATIFERPNRKRVLFIHLDVDIIFVLKNEYRPKRIPSHFEPYTPVA